MGSEGVPGSGGQLRVEHDIWLGQHFASDLLDPAHAVLLGVFLQAGGLIAMNQNECLFTFNEEHRGKRGLQRSFETR